MTITHVFSLFSMAATARMTARIPKNIPHFLTAFCELPSAHTVLSYLMHRRFITGRCLHQIVGRKPKNYLSSSAQYLANVKHPSPLAQWPVLQVHRAVCTETLCCWKCGKTIDHVDNRFFCECGLVQKPVKNISYFEVLGVESTFKLDPSELQQIFRNLQRKLHPDRFSQKSEEEREYSSEQSSLVNKAYQTLSKPLSRGLYLLELHGMPIQEGEIQLDPSFLMEIMEINEDLIECETEACVKRVKEKNDTVLDELIQKFDNALQQKELENAKLIMSKIKYYANIDEKIKEKEEMLIS